MSTPQKPSVGRMVHFYPPRAAAKGQPYPATITHAWDDDTVNLSVANDGSESLPAGELHPVMVKRSEDPAVFPRWDWPPKV